MEQKNLRWGYTTGTCAAAAAKAAAAFWLTGKEAEQVTVSLPGGGSLTLPVSVWARERGWYRVRKDAGDDPDVTDGAWICACVEPIDRQELQTLKETGRGYFLEAYPDLYVTGGEGVGIATRAGLSCPEGHYAINPGPRQMILSEVSAVRAESEWEGGLLIRIQVPEGRRLANRTFNPKLGIEGGISVLGTTGLVKPMSEEALVETIRLEIHMEAVLGRSVLLMVPGNYGETFLREKGQVETGQAVVCSNFVQEGVQCAAAEGFQELLFVAHIGKLVKVSGGAGNTHSKYGDGRMEQMASLAAACIAEDDLNRIQMLEEIKDCTTTEASLGILSRGGYGEAVLRLAAAEASRYMEQWSGQALKVQVVTFSTAYGILGATDGAWDMLKRWKSQRGLGEACL